MKQASAVLAMLATAAMGGCGNDAADSVGTTRLAAETRQVCAASAAIAIAGYRDNFTIARDAASGVVTLTDRISGAVQTHANPGAIVFVDRTVSFDIDGLPGKVYRLYQAAFDRKPDMAGLGFWIKAAQQGTSLADIANGFIASDEFRALYGSDVDDKTFLTRLYNNILHRAPEPTGLDWWIATAASGVTRDSILNAFSESAENIDNVNPGVLGGFEYLPFQPGGPLLPFATSYQNKNAIKPAATGLPSSYDPAMSNILAAMDASDIGFGERSLSFGDFNQDGTLAVFAAMTRFNGIYPADNKQHWPDSPARAYFMHLGPDGKWVDDTARRIPDARDRMICVTPSYSIVADFNSDGKPDIHIACTGVDFPVAGVWDDASEQHMFLSQADGTYRHVVLPIGKIYGHQASAADIDGDGRIDIVTTDPKTHQTPFILWGRGDGTFTQDTTRMPADMLGKAIFGAMLVPVDGTLRLVASGNAPGSHAGSDPTDYGTKVLTYRNGRFDYDIDLTPTLPATAAGFRFGLAIDHIYSKGYLYSTHVSADYSEQALTRTDLRDGATSTIFGTRDVDYTKAISQIFLGDDGFIRYFGIGCNAYDATSREKCAYRIAP